MKDSSGNVIQMQKLVCDQSNWPLNTLWSHNFVFSGLSLRAGESITIEADFYCSYCYHWYATPKTFVPNKYSIVFVPLNWQGDLSPFDTYVQTHASFAIDHVEKLTSDNTKIVKVSQNLQLDFDKTNPDNFGDAQWNAIINHAVNNGVTGDVYIALTNEGIWGDVAGMTRSLYGNVIVVDSDGLGETETTAHELGHTWGMLDEYNYIIWTTERNYVRSGYDFNSYPTSDDPNMPYPPPDYDDVRCPGRSFDDQHCIMGPAGHWYMRRIVQWPIPIDLPWYFGGTKGFCPECYPAIDKNIEKSWGSTSGGLAKLIITFFKNGTLPTVEQTEGIPMAGKSMYFGGDGNYSIQVYSEAGACLYTSNVSYSFLMNLPSKTANCTAMPLEVDSRTIMWLAPAFSENKVTVELRDNVQNEVITSQIVTINPITEAWIDYKTTDKDIYDFGETIQVTTEINTTLPSMDVALDVSLLDPNSIVQDYKSWIGTIYPTADPIKLYMNVPSSGITGTWTVYVVVLNSTGQYQDSETNLIDVGVQYYLDVVVDPATLPPILGADWYDECTWVKLTAPQYVPNATGVGGVRYDFSYWDVDGTSRGMGVNPIDIHMNASHTATAYFVLQYNITFAQTGVGSDFTGTVVTIDGTNYDRSGASFWYDSGSTHNFTFQLPLVVPPGAKQYAWTSTTGLSTSQSGSITVAGPGNVTGNYVTKVHDVAVTSVVADRKWVYQGFSANINVTVLNKGDFAENVTVTLYYNITANKIIGTQNVTLSQGDNKTITFVWGTTGVPYCHNYTITAVATIAADNYPADNTLADGAIKVRILGDINGDGQVDIFDVRQMALAFGSYPGDPKWNPDADLNQSGGIDMFDIRLAVKNFGKCI